MRLLLIPVAWMFGVVAFTFFGGMLLGGKKISERTSSVIFYGGIGIITVACLVWLVAALT